MADDQNTNEDKTEGYQTLDYILGGLILISSFIYGTIPSKPQPENDAQDTNHEIAHWTRVVGRWTRVLAGVGALTVGAILAQAYILYLQVDESELDRRAWLAPKTVDAPVGFIMQDKGPYKPTTITFNFTNTGKEPATYVHRIIRYKFLENTPWDPVQDANKIGEILNGRSCKDFNTDPNGDTVFPNDADQIAFALTANETQIVQGGNHWMMVAGCLIYRTIESTRWTEVCRFLDPIDLSVTPGPPGFRSAVCPIHNQAH